MIQYRSHRKQGCVGVRIPELGYGYEISHILGFQDGLTVSVTTLYSPENLGAVLSNLEHSSRISNRTRTESEPTFELQSRFRDSKHRILTRRFEPKIRKIRFRVDASDSRQHCLLEASLTLRKSSSCSMISMPALVMKSTHMLQILSRLSSTDFAETQATSAIATTAVMAKVVFISSSFFSWKYQSNKLSKIKQIELLNISMFLRSFYIPQNWRGKKRGCKQGTQLPMINFAL